METHITINRNTKALPISSDHSFTEPVVDERRRAVNQLIIGAHAGYSATAPQDEAMVATVEVWKDALDEAGVPTSQFRNLLKKCLAGRGSNYPPGVSEICTKWREHLISLPTRTIQEEDAEKAKALPQAPSPLLHRGIEVGKQTRARFAAGKGNVQCDCGQPATMSHDYFDWVCGQKKDACAFSWPVGDTFNAPVGKGKVGPMGDGLTDAKAKHNQAMPEPGEGSCVSGYRAYSAQCCNICANNIFSRLGCE